MLNSDYPSPSPSSSPSHDGAIKGCHNLVEVHPGLHEPITSLLSGPITEFIPAVLDPSSNVLFIRTMQHDPSLATLIYSLVRSWTWAIHKERLKLLGLSEFIRTL